MRHDQRNSNQRTYARSENTNETIENRGSGESTQARLNGTAKRSVLRNTRIR